MANTNEYYLLETLREKNLWFRNLMSEKSFSKATITELWELLNICFDLFRFDFENNDYENYEYVSHICEKILNIYLSKKSLDNIINENEIDFIIDIVCFVYELTYKYSEKAQILKKVIENTNITNSTKTRVLENIIAMELETTLFSKNDIQNYLYLLNNLTNNDNI